MNIHNPTLDSAHFSPYRPDGKLYGFVCVVTGAQQPVGQAIIHELAGVFQSSQNKFPSSTYTSCMRQNGKQKADSSKPTVQHAYTYTACDKASSSGYETLEAEVAKISPNTKIIGYPFNVAKEDETLGLIDDVLNSWGRLDVWVCSSGLLGPPSLEATTPFDLQNCFEANSMAPFFALKYAPPAMAKTTPKQAYPNAAPKDQKYGSIIVVSSVASTYGGCWGPCYTMSCHAALGVVRAGVAVLKGSGVRINCISPGQIDVGVDLKGFDMRGMTAQFPPSSLQTKEMQQQTIGLERAGLPQEVGRVAGFLASGFSSYITGANLVVDGGASVMNPLAIPI